MFHRLELRYPQRGVLIKVNEKLRTQERAI
jgi:hypothetical protein